MKAGSIISKLKNRYLAMRVLETVAFGTASALAVVALLLLLNVPLFPVIAMATIAFGIVVVSRIRYLRIGSLNDQRIASWLNAEFPMLKESSDLLIKKESELTTLERLQLTRIDQAVQQIAPTVKLPHHLMMATGTMLIGAGLLIVSTAFVQPDLSTGSATEPNNIEQLVAPDSSAVAALEKISITLTPPSYTGIPQSTTTTPNIKIAEGTSVQWNLSFTSQPDKVRITFSNGQQESLQLNNDIYQLRRVINLPVLYQVEWTAAGKTQTSDYARVDVKIDQPPVVAIADMPQFTRLMWGEKENIEIRSTIRDDYSISAAHIIATVSKGSGESVKFREEKLAFTSPGVIRGSNIVGQRILDFKRLGMEPGDEVYFYVEAFDNKQPTPQRSRTETFFVALLDTAANDITVDSGLGIDIMPDYFRSQRQLIIDTEKLLAEQTKITKHQFNSTSNELGYDQKVLRLRYGQFMGEEFETAIGQPTNVQEAVEEEDEDLMKQFGHQHDTENEHNLVADKKLGKEPEHGHDHEEKKEGEEEDPMAAFRHDHDNEDVATFFNLSIKAKLRAALSLMWESELQLRLYQPKASLPHQYQILKLLKEIAQDSRIYVHRMGFDPPPLKEDKRLTADLDEIHNSTVDQSTPPSDAYPSIAGALSSLNTALEVEKPVVTPLLKSQLQAAGNELASIAINQPGNFLDALSTIKAVIEGNSDSTSVHAQLELIQAAFIQALPPRDASPMQRRSATHPLDMKLLEEIKARTNE